MIFVRLCLHFHGIRLALAVRMMYGRSKKEGAQICFVYGRKNLRIIT